MVDAAGSGQSSLGDATTNLLLTLVPLVVSDLATNAPWPTPVGLG